MNKLFAILTLALVTLVGAEIIGTAEIIPLPGNKGASIPVLNRTDADVNLDTSEIDTSARWFNVIDREIRTFTDTIGRVFMRCDDSSGTDSVGGRLIWQGNPHPQGKAVWTAMDSVSIAVASGAETQTSGLVVNSSRYSLIRFILRNQLAPGGSAAEKSVCRNVRLNISPYLTVPAN